MLYPRWEQASGSRFAGTDFKPPRVLRSTGVVVSEYGKGIYKL